MLPRIVIVWAGTGWETQRSLMKAKITNSGRRYCFCILNGLLPITPIIVGSRLATAGSVTKGGGNLACILREIGWPLVLCRKHANSRALVLPIVCVEQSNSCAAIYSRLHSRERVEGGNPCKSTARSYSGRFRRNLCKAVETK